MPFHRSFCSCPNQPAGATRIPENLPSHLLSFPVRSVLGPGSDGYHEEHVHVDLMPRRPGRFAMCQWQVRDPESRDAAARDIAPLPPPRPKEAPAPAASRRQQ